MASAPKLPDPDTRSSLAEKGLPPRKFVDPSADFFKKPEPTPPHVAIKVPPTGYEILQRAIGPGYSAVSGKRRTIKQKRRRVKKTQKRRGRK